MLTEFAFLGQGPVALSPDASAVAYCVRRLRRSEVPTYAGFLENGVPADASGSEIRITSIRGEGERRLTPDWGSSWAPSWSPDGRKLAFYSDRSGQPQVWTWDRETDVFHCVCTAPVCVFMGYERPLWSPDGLRLVIKLRSPGWAPPRDGAIPESSPRTVWVSPPPVQSEPGQGEGWRPYDVMRGDVAVVDLETGATNRVGAGLIPSSMALAHDGRHLAVQSLVDVVTGANGVAGLYDLHLLELAQGHGRVIVSRFPGSRCAFSWSPTESVIAYRTNGLGPGQLHTVSLEGEDRIVAGDDSLCLGNRQEDCPPLWSADGRTIYCRTEWGAVYAASYGTAGVRKIASDDARPATGIVRGFGSGTVSELGRPGTIVVTTQNRQSLQEGMLRLGDAAAAPIVEERPRSLTRFAQFGDAAGCWIVGQIEDASNPPDLYSVDTQTGQQYRLTCLNPSITVPAGPTKLISYLGPSGKETRAALLLPPDYERGKRYPTIISLYYGVPQSQYCNLFGSTEAWLASEGYVVVLPNLPRSAEDPAEAIATLALAVANGVVLEGDADPDRLGIIGGSQGGYNVCCVISRTSRFRAAVAVASFTDLVNRSLTVDGNRLLKRGSVMGEFVGMGKSFWDDKLRYIENSPAFHCDSVTTPLLLLHGTADGACPVGQAEMMYAGLLELGKPATLVRYHGEDHAVNRWSEENQQDYRMRIREWFGRYLTCRPDQQ